MIVKRIIFVMYIFSLVFLWSCDKPEGEDTITPQPFNQVVLEDDFWLPRLQRQVDVLLPFALEKTKPAVENLRKAGDVLHNQSVDLPFPHRYRSSDLYKVMEGAAYLLKIQPDKKLEARMDSIIHIIGRAQKEDGYLYIAHTAGVAHKHPVWGGAGMGDKPYSWVLHSHELYNMGHMYEAAVAYFQATGKRNWLDIAEKNAKHINKVFFEGDPNYNNGKPVNQAPGHQEIELGLIKLYRATGNRLYLEMANRFLSIRGVTFIPEGDGVMAPEYAQQHLPVAKQEKAIGHSVRAAYMYSAMAEIESLLPTDEYDHSLNSIWSNIVDTRMHITGGLGAVRGIEGFGPEYELPNANAYNETCAAVANVFFNFRMFLLTKEAKYLDVAEVALYNNVLAGVNLEGNKFFYVNPLEFDGKTKFNHGTAGRSPWFSTACCPSNLARLIPQVTGLMYSYNDHEIYTGLYAGASTSINIKGVKVQIKQETTYPFDGTVRFKVTPEKARRFGLNLRIPTWAQDQFVPGKLYAYSDSTALSYRIFVNGELVDAECLNGFVKIERKWRKDDVVELVLPMPVHFNECDSRVAENQGMVAVTRGPLVYCGEEIDNEKRIGDYRINPKTDNEQVSCCVSKNSEFKGILTLSLPVKLEQSERLNMIPYYAWNNRENSPMKVWFPIEKNNLRDE